jgi:hypothetical protein
VKDSFYEELEHVFDKFLKYRRKIVLGHFNAKEGWDMDWISLAQTRDKSRAVVNVLMNRQTPQNSGTFPSGPTVMLSSIELVVDELVLAAVSCGSFGCRCAVA